MDALDAYVKKYPQGKDIVANRNRLFLDEIEATNWQEALALWPKLPDTTRSDLGYRTAVLKAYVGLNKTKIADTLAVAVLKEEPKNVPALDYLAQKYFWLAENSYRAENKAYEKNHTYQQYAKLIAAYKVITRNYQRSLAYFKTLFPLERTSQNARYLSDIYGRLTNKKKADYYRALSKKLK